MNKAPAISEIKNWLRKKNLLGDFRRHKIVIKDIDPKLWSGHFNFFVASGNKKFVLRFKGPEWGKKEGIIDEYKVLKLVEKYKVGPKVYCLTKDFFGEPAILMEYLDGKIFTELSFSEQRKLLPRVAGFIGRINKIPIVRLPFGEPRINYVQSKIVWEKRLKVILKNKIVVPWGLKIKKLLPKAKKILDSFEPRLNRVLKKHGPFFIFESAHAGHLMRVKEGFRFLNWEKVSYGDPSFTLVVFLASISGKSDFPGKSDLQRIIAAYTKVNYIPEFRELLYQRVFEREVSNLIWVLWAYCQRKDMGPVGKVTGVNDRFNRVQKLVSKF